MHLVTEAILCAVRPHGEHGAIARLLTAESGLIAGYVRGGRSRRLKPVLVPGNLVRAEFRARTEEQLAGLTVELARSRAPLLAEPLAASAIEWATALAAAALPEAQAYPRLFAALAALLDAIEAAPSARGWAGALIRYELLVQAELGYADDYAAILPPLEAGWAALFAALRANGEALRCHLFADRRDWALDARERLLARLRRVV